MKALLAAFALLVPTATAPACPDLAVVDTGAIVQIDCPVADGWIMGTGFRIGNLLVTAKHVISHDKCFYVGGGNAEVAYSSPSLDYAILKGGKGPFIRVDCDGFVKGKKYLAVGYARGAPYLTTVELTATGSNADGFAILSGIFTFIPGMSGGPVIDEETGKVVGLINVFQEPEGIIGSVELKNTSVCK